MAASRPPVLPWEAEVQREQAFRGPLVSAELLDMNSTCPKPTSTHVD